MAEGIRATPTIACTTSSLRNRSRCAKRRPPVSTVTNKANAMSSTGIWLGEVRTSGNACANTWRTPRCSRYLITATSPPQSLTGKKRYSSPASSCPSAWLIVASHNPTIPKEFFRTMRLSLPQTNFFGLKIDPPRRGVLPRGGPHVGGGGSGGDPGLETAGGNCEVERAGLELSGDFINGVSG